MVSRIIVEARDVLAMSGAFIDSEEARTMLLDAGARAVRGEAHRLRIPGEMIDAALASLPGSVRLFDRGGGVRANMEGERVQYAPIAVAALLHDLDARTLRRATTRDCHDLSRLTDAMEHVPVQSAALVPTDVPDGMAAAYRLYLALRASPKPVFLGAATVDGLESIRNMLLAVRGDSKKLKDKPLLIAEVRPASPLKWRGEACGLIVRCARAGVPVVLTSMLRAGATAPVTLAGALVQHTAEMLSGLVLAQVAEAGSSVVLGGIPGIFEMRKGTVPMGAAETQLLACAATRIGRFLGAATHTSLGLSDAKVPDAQAGIEAGLGIALGSLAGANLVAGIGALGLGGSFSFEKLAIDNEICGLALRLIHGIAQHDDPIAVHLLSQVEESGQFLGYEHTQRWYRAEQFYPSAVIDRASVIEWRKAGEMSALNRAHERVQKLLAAPVADPLSQDAEKELRMIIRWEAKRHGLAKLPSLP